MGLAISEDHLALEETARRFLEARCPATVPRSVLETEKEELPPFWAELVDLGWLSLHVDYGLAALAVVLEELGRAVAPGPFLPAALAASLAPSVADGRTIATVALSGALAVTGDGRVSGTVGPVLCAGLAEAIVARTEDGRWCVVSAPAFSAAPTGSVDPTRRLYTVTVDPTVVEQWLEVDDSRVWALAAAMFAAEAAGVAGWCVDASAEYAKVREQFGRPIGQFQGVKHRCADMLVALEQARAVAWDAAAALDDGWSEAAGLAASIAGAIGPDVAFRVAKDCVQVHGGIGFTWEHDAHLYLRRATAVRSLLGGSAPWRARVASAARAGVRRPLRVDLPPEAERVREEVRAFAQSLAGLDKAEQRARVVDAGYFVPHWPPPWGRSAGAVEQLVIDEELRAARVRRPNLAVGAWAAPTIAVYGTPEQQDRWVRPTLTGEITWCQLFSEPGAGSDLAALTTRATSTEGGWLVNGQKVWTSMARDADWGICLVRTDPDVPKHLGITYLIVDMRSPGIEIRPLRELTGFAMFNEVFFTDVFVPDDCVIGQVDGGWPLARTTLANERVAMASGSTFGGGVEALLALAAGVDDPVVLDQVGAIVAEAQSVALLGFRTTCRSVSGARPGPEASVRKLLGVEHDQRTQELGLALLGADGATTAGPAEQWTFGFLANRCLTIAGGTSEIQRNVIAERLLGLPRDP